ncbi:MAG: hypothetical protein QM768_19340 [Agriterribacter sp.]
MKTTILSIAFGLITTTIFAQESNVNSSGSLSAVQAVKADKVAANGNAEAILSAEAPGKVIKKTKKAIHKTKSGAETTLKETSDVTKEAVSNTNASASVQSKSSLNSTATPGNNNNAALSVKSKNSVTVEKEIKGKDVAKAAGKVEVTADGGLKKAGSKIKTSSAEMQSALKSEGTMTAKPLSAKPAVTTILKSRPVKAGIRTKAIAGVRIR